MYTYSDKKIRRYFDKAKEASRLSDFPRYHLGAIAVYKNDILALGNNCCKTSPVQKHYNKERHYQTEAAFKNTNTLHAEVNCLNKIKMLDIDFSKVSLFVYREHKNGKKAMARPCPACSKMIKDLGIKSIYYTTDNGFCHESFD